MQPQTQTYKRNQFSFTDIKLNNNASEVNAQNKTIKANQLQPNIPGNAKKNYNSSLKHSTGILKHHYIFINCTLGHHGFITEAPRNNFVPLEFFFPFSIQYDTTLYVAKLVQTTYGTYRYILFVKASANYDKTIVISELLPKFIGYSTICSCQNLTQVCAPWKICIQQGHRNSKNFENHFHRPFILATNSLLYQGGQLPVSL